MGKIKVNNNGGGAGGGQKADTIAITHESQMFDKNEAFQPSYLSFSLTYPDGRTRDCTAADGDVDLTPRWNSILTTPGTFQGTAAIDGLSTNFSYIVTNWSDYKIVGGRIFYLHNQPISEYLFFDENYNQLTDYSIAGLETAKYYKKSLDYSGIDKIYVYYNTKQACDYGNKTKLIGTSSAIGSGKSNTASALSKYSWIFGYSYYYISQWRKDNIGGCNDWYMGSKDEVEKLRVSNLQPELFTDSMYGVWSSTEQNASDAWRYNNSIGWFTAGKDARMYCFPMRSF